MDSSRNFDYSRRDGHSAPMLIRTLFFAVLLSGLTLADCTSRKANSIQFVRTSDLWMCQPDAAREDWDCVQDSARARAIEENTASDE